MLFTKIEILRSAEDLRGPAVEAGTYDPEQSPDWRCRTGSTPSPRTLTIDLVSDLDGRRRAFADEMPV